MPTSQFRQYTSADVGAPPLTGISGSLVSVLNYCLISGSGWSQPFSSGSVFASYQPPSGSRMTLFVNDAAPTFAAGGKEAWMTGWENLTGLGTAPGGNLTGSVGAGTGQFPLPAQALTDGKVVCRKSANATTGSIPYWTVFADSYTMYAFFMSGDYSTYAGYMSAWFGDIFSLKGTDDAYRCMIHGRMAVNYNSSGQTADNLDMLGAVGTTAPNSTGMYIARASSGIGSSITANKIGDCGKYGGTAGNMFAAAGIVTAPNPSDNSFIIAPIAIWEHATLAIRGRVRGMWHFCHPFTTIPDGATFSGSNSHVGKVFKKIGPGINGGMWLIEISNTVETN